MLTSAPPGGAATGGDERTAKNHNTFAARLIKSFELAARRSGARDVQQALGADNDFTDPRKAGRHVLEARFALGLNNSAYLGADVVPLHTTQVEAGGTDELHAPRGLFPQVERAGRVGLLEALKAEVTVRRAEAERALIACYEALRWMLKMPEVAEFVHEELEYYWAKDSKALAIFQSHLKTGRAPDFALQRDKDNHIANLEMVHCVAHALIAALSSVAQQKLEAQLEHTTQAGVDHLQYSLRTLARAAALSEDVHASINNLPKDADDTAERLGVAHTPPKAPASSSGAVGPDSGLSPAVAPGWRAPSIEASTKASLGDERMRALEEAVVAAGAVGAAGAGAGPLEHLRVMLESPSELMRARGGLVLHELEQKGMHTDVFFLASFFSGMIPYMFPGMRQDDRVRSQQELMQDHYMTKYENFLLNYETISGGMAQEYVMTNNTKGGAMLFLNEIGLSINESEQFYNARQFAFTQALGRVSIALQRGAVYNSQFLEMTLGGTWNAVAAQEFYRNLEEARKRVSQNVRLLEGALNNTGFEEIAMLNDSTMTAQGLANEIKNVARRSKTSIAVKQEISEMRQEDTLVAWFADLSTQFMTISTASKSDSPPSRALKVAALALFDDDRVRRAIGESVDPKPTDRRSSQATYNRLREFAPWLPATPSEKDVAPDAKTQDEFSAFRTVVLEAWMERAEIPADEALGEKADTAERREQAWEEKLKKEAQEREQERRKAAAAAMAATHLDAATEALARNPVGLQDYQIAYGPIMEAYKSSVEEVKSALKLLSPEKKVGYPTNDNLMLPFVKLAPQAHKHLINAVLYSVKAPQDPVVREGFEEWLKNNINKVYKSSLERLFTYKTSEVGDLLKWEGRVRRKVFDELKRYVTNKMEALRAKENGDFKEAKRLDLEREQKPSAETMERLRDEGLQEVVEKWMEGINEGEGLLADFLADVAYVERERDGREGTPTVEMPQTLFVEPSYNTNTKEEKEAEQRAVAKRAEIAAIFRTVAGRMGQKKLLWYRSGSEQIYMNDKDVATALNIAGPLYTNAVREYKGKERAPLLVRIDRPLNLATVMGAFPPPGKDLNAKEDEKLIKQSKVFQKVKQAIVDVSVQHTKIRFEQFKAQDPATTLEDLQTGMTSEIAIVKVFEGVDNENRPIINTTATTNLENLIVSELQGKLDGVGEVLKDLPLTKITSSELLAAWKVLMVRLQTDRYMFERRFRPIQDAVKMGLKALESDPTTLRRRFVEHVSFEQLSRLRVNYTAQKITNVYNDNPSLNRTLVNWGLVDAEEVRGLSFESQARLRAIVEELGRLQEPQLFDVLDTGAIDESFSEYVIDQVAEEVVKTVNAAKKRAEELKNKEVYTTEDKETARQQSIKLYKSFALVPLRQVLKYLEMSPQWLEDTPEARVDKIVAHMVKSAGNVVKEGAISAVKSAPGGSEFIFGVDAVFSVLKELPGWTVDILSSTNPIGPVFDADNRFDNLLKNWALAASGAASGVYNSTIGALVNLFNPESGRGKVVSTDYKKEARVYFGVRKTVDDTDDFAQFTQMLKQLVPEALEKKRPSETRRCAS